MKIHHIAIWTFQLEEMKSSTHVTSTGAAMKSTSTPKKDSNLISFTSMKERIWN